MSTRSTSSRAASGDRPLREGSQVQTSRDARREDAAERAGVLEERRQEHEQGREHEERLGALLDRDSGEHVDEARDHEHGSRLDHDAAQDLQAAAKAGHQRDEAGDHAESGDHRCEEGGCRAGRSRGTGSAA